MDDIFGDIIYILLTLGLVIFSALKKRKANKRATPSSEKEVRDPMDKVFPTLKGFFGDESKQYEEGIQENEAPVESQSASQPGGSPFIKEDYVFTAREGAKAARRSRKIPKRKLLEVEDRIYNDQEDYYGTENFNLRQAVIYSEILKRPEI